MHEQRGTSHDEIDELERGRTTRSQRQKRETELKPRPIRIEDYRAGSRTDLRIPIYQNALGSPMDLPFVVIRGRHPGPVLGICAAIHGDELNGIKIIHHVLDKVDPDAMHGSLLCAPIANVPAFESQQRRFPDGIDLNHAFPGKAEGKPSEQYARAFLVTFLTPCDYLVDIHTASEGRINSMYVRADLRDPTARKMAHLMNPQIILHVTGGDGSLRHAAKVRGIPAITVEAGNPSVFQGAMAYEGEQGVMNLLYELEILNGQPTSGRAPVVCKSSKWLRTRVGGLLETAFSLTDRIQRKQLLAQIRDPFGHVIQEYQAPHDGIVIGMAESPVAVPGTRYVHLGVIGDPPPQRATSTEAAALPDATPTVTSSEVDAGAPSNTE